MWGSCGTSIVKSRAQDLELRQQPALLLGYDTVPRTQSTIEEQGKPISDVGKIETPSVCNLRPVFVVVVDTSKGANRWEHLGYLYPTSSSATDQGWYCTTVATRKACLSKRFLKTTP